MRWLLKKGSPWGDNTFRAAAIFGSIDNLEWLLSNGCDFNTSIQELQSIQQLKSTSNAHVISWMVENKWIK